MNNINFEMYSVIMKAVSMEHAENMESYKYFTNNTKAMRELVMVATEEWKQVPMDLMPSMGSAFTNMRAQGLAYCKAAELILKGCDVDIRTFRHIDAYNHISFEVVAEDFGEYHRY